MYMYNLQWFKYYIKSLIRKISARLIITIVDFYYFSKEIKKKKKIGKHYQR